MMSLAQPRPLNSPSNRVKKKKKSNVCLDFCLCAPMRSLITLSDCCNLIPARTCDTPRSNYRHRSHANMLMRANVAVKEAISRTSRVIAAAFLSKQMWRHSERMSSVDLPEAARTRPGLLNEPQKCHSRRAAALHLLNTTLAVLCEYTAVIILLIPYSGFYCQFEFNSSEV